MRVWTVVAAVAVIGAGGGVAVSYLHSPIRVHAIPWPLVAVAMVAFYYAPVLLHFRSQTQIFDLSGVAILVGSVLVAPSRLVLAVALAPAAYDLLHRNPLMKAAFNVASSVAMVTAAVPVVYAVMGSSSPASPRGWLALGLGAVTVELVSGAAVLAVTTVSGGFPGVGVLKQMALQLAVLPLIEVALTVIVVACYLAEPWAILVPIGPSLLLGWSYSRAERMRSRFVDLQSLYSFSRSLAEVSERTDVLAVALNETRSVLHCDHAELCVAQPEGLIRYRLTDSADVVEEVVDLASTEATVLQTQRAVLLAHSSRDEYLGQRGIKDAMFVPISIGGTKSAVLGVTDRHGSDSTSFTREDQDFLQALAAHLSTALTSSDHLDHLRRSVAEREHQAYHDSLTGLANRTLFMNVVAAALENSGSNRMVAVVLMDLDGFKEINDALGHHTGDAVLRIIATRVSAGVREFGVAARLGGDEFAFLVPAAESLDEITAITERLMESVGASMEIDNVALTVRASVGISLAPMHGLDAASLLKKADVAMYGAKSSSRRITVYDQSMDNSSARRLALATDLGRAIDADELDLWFQPVADMASGRISGFEALLRWPHPALGFVAPDEFIPIAEQTGLIEPLTWWVMRRALSEQRRWRDEGYEFTMAVNMSVRTLLDVGIVERLRETVAEYGLTPANLTLEITESSMMVELERSEAVLRSLSDLGFKIAIDDFGTGYSSLSRLKVLPVHVVKVDRAFVKNICADKGDQAIVRSIIELAGVMGHTVVAEGIEDLPTWSRLAALGCDLGQGYYFARPMLATDCREWVLERQPPSLATVRPLTKRIGGSGA